MIAVWLYWIMVLDSEVLSSLESSLHSQDKLSVILSNIPLQKKKNQDEQRNCKENDHFARVWGPKITVSPFWPKSVEEQHYNLDASQTIQHHSWSKGQHKAAAERDREATISQAVESIKTGQASLDITAVKHDIPKGTLYGRAYHGRKNCQLAHEDEQSLRLAEEDELLCWLRELDAWGLHLRRRIVMHCAEAILSYRAEKYGLDTPTHLSVNWFSHFTHRHPDVQTALRQLKDVSWSQAERDPIRISKFYSNISSRPSSSTLPPYSHILIPLTPSTSHTSPENGSRSAAPSAYQRYNFEEKGFMMGMFSREHVVVFSSSEDDRAAGQATVICMAKDSKLEKAWIAASPNGWTDNELGIAWLQKCFDRCTQENHEEWPSSTGDKGSLSSELVDAFGGELLQIILDPSEDELGGKENDRRTAGYKRRAEEPVEDKVRGRPNQRIVRPDCLNL
ncbi:hypothetical protein C8R45DRAFT_937458 [Mycena sanguinolenta]|nr:hypothetical protein C8R45DRAFT_937458 [Mycena sanguinolenta]